MLDRLGIAGLMMIRLKEHGYPRFFIVSLPAHTDAGRNHPISSLKMGRQL